jgi:hypothetical protein
MFDQAVEIYENLDDLLASIRADWVIACASCRSGT